MYRPDDADALRWILRTLLLLALLAVLPAAAFADGPKDNHPQNVRRVPRLGVEVSEQQRQELEAGLKRLAGQVASLKESKAARVRELLPDVEIFHRAVDTALKHQEFFSPRDILSAGELLAEGSQRAEQLQQGQAPWTQATGLVVRGYVSRIDHTVQPYGLVVPDSYTWQGTGRHRLDLWFHGRGETLGEVSFINQRMNQVGQYAPAGTFVLHPYGRYSNAFKFAGEVDVLEALEHAQKNYRIDPDRIAVRGFSMGGAACWQFAVHYADRWFAANPGAGFSETPEFLKSFQQETLNPTWFERKLWRMYDCPGYAINLYHCPTVAYSGELDIQKQAADVMEQALAEVGIDLVHVIGPGTKHSIHPQSKLEIEDRLASLAQRGREQVPRHVRLSTYTLKYNRMNWVNIDSLGLHWEQAQVDAELRPQQGVQLTTENVTALTLHFPSGWCPLDMTRSPQLLIDGQQLSDAPRPLSDRSWSCPLHRVGDQWRIGEARDEGLRKRHNLQGPIDDAFMDSFIFVRPTGKSPRTAVEKWTRAELDHAIEHWRRHFRGDARVKDDTQISDEDVASANLILFGDPDSNSVLARIRDGLPIHWNDQGVTVGDRRFDGEHHAPVLIYPNPLNPDRYVVLNSGFTYREYAYLNNARQVPMLPDWAVVDLREPPGSQWPGKIVEAGFFDEQWKLQKQAAR